MKTFLRPIIFVLAITTFAAAGAINIQFTGMDLAYDGSTLMTQASSDELSSVVIIDAVGTSTKYTSKISIDLNIPDLTLPLFSQTSATGSLTLNVPGGSLALGLDPVVVKHTDVGAIEFVFGGASTHVISQSVPDLMLTDPVTFSFSQTINAGTQTHDGANLTGFTSFGTGEITSVPEPATAGLVSMATLSLLGLCRRRRSHQSIRKT